MREQMSLTAAFEVRGLAREMRLRIRPFIHAHVPDARIDWQAVSEFVATAEADGERFNQYASVIRPAGSRNIWGGSGRSWSTSQTN